MIGLAAAFSFESYAQKTKYALEIDPATFAFGGYSAHLRIAPKKAEHLLLGIGAYAMNMPSVMVDLNSKNKNEGWDVRLNQGYGLFGEYYFCKNTEKFFVGTQLGIQEYKIENEAIEGDVKFTNLLSMVYGGYTWRPFTNPLYLKPWAGLGYVSKLSGDNVLGGKAYDVASLTMFATLHIGYTF
jgi:hypothetical protein